MYKPNQGELQLDRFQLSYLEHLGFSTIGGSPAQNHKRPTTRCKDNGLTPFAHLINDVSLFSVLFLELSYSHIGRGGNKTAHSLARLALISPSCTVWMENVPYHTLPFVQADLAAL